MAHYTPIHPEEIYHLLPLLQLGELIHLGGIAAGIVNSNYHLITTTGEYIVTLVEQDGEELPYLTALLTHLKQHGLPVPYPIADGQGLYIHTIHRKPTLVTPFFPGLSPTQPNPNQCHAIGLFLGQLHQTSNSFLPKRSNPMGTPKWRNLLNILQIKNVENRQEILQLLHEELANYQTMPSNLAMGICHADLFPDNTLFVHDTLQGVIDFYYACHEYLIYDLAITINAWCFDTTGELNVSCLQSLWQGYHHHRLPTALEIDHLALALRGAALRFALTRLHYYQNTPPEQRSPHKNPQEYIQRLHFHRHHNLAKLITG